MPRISESVVVALVFVAVGWGAKDSAALLLPEDLPRNTVAVISDVPVSLGRITRAEFQRRLVEMAAVEGRDFVPEPGERGYARLEKATIGELLDGVWIRGQADEMGIAVTPRQVSRELARLKRLAFKSDAEYHRFLREAHYTQRDVRERVELQLLASAIRRRIERWARWEVKEFIEAFEERWRARTVCAPEYAIDRCSNGSPAGQGP